MPHRSSADIWLAKLGHVNSALNPGGDTYFFERMLKSKSVDDRGQHTHVIARGPIHSGRGGFAATEDIPATDDDRQLKPLFMDFG